VLRKARKAVSLAERKNINLYICLQSKRWYTKRRFFRYFSTFRFIALLRWINSLIWTVSRGLKKRKLLPDTDVDHYHHPPLIPLHGVGTTYFLLPFPSITRHRYVHSFYSHVILHTVYPFENSHKADPESFPSGHEGRLRRLSRYSQALGESHTRFPPS
jgi:hypothetical protein